MKKLAFLFFIGTFFLSCSKEKCNYDECAVTATASEVQSLQDYLQTNNITATQHCSGIFYVIDQPGSGTRPKGCSNVVVKYKGTLTNGNTFDETPAGQTANFDLDGLIRGFTNGAMQIKKGGKVTVYIPPSLGYGSQPNGPIPANSILIFSIELVEVN